MMLIGISVWGWGRGGGGGGEGRGRGHYRSDLFPEIQSKNVCYLQYHAADFIRDLPASSRSPHCLAVPHAAGCVPNSSTFQGILGKEIWFSEKCRKHTIKAPVGLAI